MKPKYKQPKYNIGDEVYYLHIPKYDISSLEIRKSKIKGIRLSEYELKYSLEYGGSFYEKEITKDLIQLTESAIDTILIKFANAYKKELIRDRK